MRPPFSNYANKMLKREKKTVSLMVRIYCKDHHKTSCKLCAECAEYKEYVFRHLEKCLRLPPKTADFFSVIAVRWGSNPPQVRLLLNILLLLQMFTRSHMSCGEFKSPIITKSLNPFLVTHTSWELSNSKLLSKTVASHACL